MGLIGMTRLPLNSRPDFSMNFLSISASYTSSSPEEVEKSITIPLEDALSTTTHLSTLSSSSRGTGASVILRFDDSVNMDLAALEVRDKLDQVRNDLPEDLRRLYVFRMDPNAAPVVYMQISWGGPGNQLYNIIENVVIRRLQRIDGVADVDTRGVYEPMVMVDMNQNALKAYGVDIRNMNRAIATNNQNVSGGYVRSAGKKYTVRSIGEYQTVEEIANTLVKSNVIRLNDIADVKYDFPEKKSVSRLNGREAVMITVQKASYANTVQVVDEIKSALAEIQANKSYEDLDILILRDEGETILTSLRALYQSGLLGAALATIVLFLFLRKLRSILIIQLAIPISVITAFLFMYMLRVFAGSTISINLVSLSGLMVSVGMLLDNSVVVLENIFRHKQEENCTAKQAAIEGTGEVSMPVVAATSTTLIVFLPMFFLGSGTLQSMTRDFSIVVCVALIASLIVALTLVPLLASRIFVGRERKPRQGIVYLRNLYGRVLTRALHWRYAVFGLAACLPFIAIWLFGQIERELDSFSESRTLEYKVFMPASFSLDEMDVIFADLEKQFLEKKEELDISYVRSYFRLSTDSGGGRGGHGGRSRPNEMELYLKEAHEGGIRDIEELKDEIGNMLPVIPGVIFKLSDKGGGMGGPGMRGPKGGGFTSRGVTIELKGPSTEVLASYAEDLENRINDMGIFQSVSTSLETDDQEISLYVNRDRANIYGLNSAQVAQTLSNALGSRATSYFKTPDGEVSISMQIDDDERMTTDDLGNLTFENDRREMIPLSTVAQMRMQPAKKTIEREERRSVVKVSVRSGYGGEDARAIMEQFMEGFALPAGYTWDFGSSFMDLAQMNSEISWIIIMAIVFIYIIMASLFESFIDPLMILFCLPTALVGVAVAYLITHTSLNSNSMNGVLILIGIVVNNGIILVDYVNQLRASGMSREEAIIQGGKTRLRPIIMTAITTILGLSPMVMAKYMPGLFAAAQGGVESYAPIGIAVVGGLSLSTFLTLLILPCVYSVMDDWSKWAARVARRLV